MRLPLPTRLLRSVSPAAMLAVVLALSFAADSARALDIEVRMGLPRLEAISGEIAVGGGTAAIELDVAYDDRGRIVKGGTCLVDGTPVDVAGKLVTRRSGVQYAITCTGDGIKVKLKGTLPATESGTAKVTYKGPRGKAKATVAVDVDLTRDVATTFTLTFDDQGGGQVTTKKGKLTGTIAVTSGYGNSPTGSGALSGKLKKGKLKLKARHARTSLVFKGTASGSGYIGTLVTKVPPDAQKLADFSIGSIGDTGGGGGSSAGPLAKSLQRLGVKVEESPRKDYSKTDDLPADYAPFGAQKTFGRIDEIVMVGATLRDDDSRFRVMELDVNGDLLQLADLDSEANAWVGFPGGPVTPQSLRAVAAGDVDGDGLEEVVAIYMDDLDLTLKLIDDAQNAYAETLVRLGVEQDVRELAVVTGDFDGDGRAELAIAVCRSDTVDIVFFEDAAGNFARQPALTKSYDDTLGLTSPQMYVQLRCGNMDYDIGCELAFVVNEYSRNGPVGTSRYVVLDDWSTDAAELQSGPVQGLANGLKTALVGSIAVGDIDGDDLDEVIVAGPTGSDGDDRYSGRLIVAFDDVANGFGTLGTIHGFNGFLGNPAFGRWRFRTTHINVVDIDGDGAFEIQANQYIYDDFANAAPFTEIHEIPQEKFLDRGSDAGAYFNDQGSQVITGDFTGDGRGDVLIYCQWQNEAYVWGLDQTVRGWREMATWEMGSVNVQDAQGGIFVAANVDTDSAVLDYGEGSYQLVFTEPIVIAALAAPPCGRGIGQNVDGCETSFGQSTTSGSERETSVSISAKAISGIKLEGGVITQSSFELTSTTEIAATRIATRSYTLEETITYISGPNDDAVIFTTIPLDQYTYTIVSHPDPTLVGKEVVISLPRKPITLKTDRSFYNDNIADGALPIDDTVFQHTIGDLSTYPTAARKNQLINQFGGLQSTLISVSQGDRAEEVQLAVSEAISTGRELAIAYELELKATGGGALAGFSVGTSASSKLTVTSGQSTIYTGRVGDLDAANFAANQYSFGLFTYVFRHPSGQQFEVLNYWVE